MKTQAYAIKDVKTDTFGLPFYSPTQGSAIRTFADAVSDPNSSFSRHPNDYILYHIGTYDDGIALLSSLVPVMLGSAYDFLPSHLQRPDLLSSSTDS